MAMTHLRIQHVYYVACILCMLIAIFLFISLIRYPLSIENKRVGTTISDGKNESANDASSPNTLPRRSKLPPLTSFEAAWTLSLRRPLYDPPPVKVEKKMFVPPPLAYRLTGTILNEKGALAMFIGPQGKIELRRVNQKIGEATILEIQQNSVQIEYYNQKQKLVLDAGKH